MSFKLGAIMGFGAGYYLGAKAGRERFEQLDRALTKVRESDAIDTATEKAKAVIDLGVERARDLVPSRQDDASGPADRRDDSITESINGRAAATPPDLA
ncbi:MAG: hypothetical protein WKF43_11755 [Acidimicrobiales bacterium]